MDGPGAGGRSKPIAIPRRRAPAGGAHPSVSQSVPPRAPIIGSMPAPSRMNAGMPDLALPATSPLAETLIPKPGAPGPVVRRVGVSSAPARSFIQMARKSSVTVGESPTVLGTLLEERAEDCDSPALGATRLSAGGSSAAALSAKFDGFNLDDRPAPPAGGTPSMLGGAAAGASASAADVGVRPRDRGYTDATDDSGSESPDTSDDEGPDDELPFQLDA